MIATHTYRAVILAAANAPYLYSLKVYFVSIIASCTHFKRLACYFSLKVGSFNRQCTSLKAVVAL